MPVTGIFQGGGQNLDLSTKPQFNQNLYFKSHISTKISTLKVIIQQKSQLLIVLLACGCGQYFEKRKNILVKTKITVPCCFQINKCYLNSMKKGSG